MLRIESEVVQHTVRQATWFAYMGEHLLIQARPLLFERGAGGVIVNVTGYALDIDTGDAIVNATLYVEGDSMFLYSGPIRTRTLLLSGVANVTECLFRLADLLHKGKL